MCWAKWSPLTPETAPVTFDRGSRWSQNPGHCPSVVFHVIPLWRKGSVSAFCIKDRSMTFFVGKQDVFLLGWYVASLRRLSTSVLCPVRMQCVGNCQNMWSIFCTGVCHVVSILIAKTKQTKQSQAKTKQKHILKSMAKLLNLNILALRLLWIPVSIESSFCLREFYSPSFRIQVFKQSYM